MPVLSPDRAGGRQTGLRSHQNSLTNTQKRNTSQRGEHETRHLTELFLRNRLALSMSQSGTVLIGPTPALTTDMGPWWSQPAAAEHMGSFEISTKSSAAFPGGRKGGGQCRLEVCAPTSRRDSTR